MKKLLLTSALVALTTSFAGAVPLNNVTNLNDPPATNDVGALPGTSLAIQNINTGDGPLSSDVYILDVPLVSFPDGGTLTFDPSVSGVFPTPLPQEAFYSVDGNQTDLTDSGGSAIIANLGPFSQFFPGGSQITLQVGFSGYQGVDTGGVSVTNIAWEPAEPVDGEIPLPASLPLLLAGMGGLGFLGWRRAKKG